MEHTIDFWDVHGIWFLIFMNFFPRITMLIATPFPISLLGWLGWLFVPRLFAALLATQLYWDTNPILVIITWLCAISVSYKTNKRGTETVYRKFEKTPWGVRYRSTITTSVR